MPVSDVVEGVATTYGLAGPAIIARDFGSELVIANLDTGIFYSCGGSAAAIWCHLQQGWPVDALTAAFSESASGHVKASVRTFIAALEAEALIVPCAGSLGPVRTVASLAFEEPTLERFDDLQGLLLVDPIHDVTEQGWPLQHAT